jgi:hypothetical protein
MPAQRDPLRIALQVGVYVFLYIATAMVFGWLLFWVGGYLVGITATGLLAALFSNWLALRIYERRPLPDIGMYWGRASAENLALGLAGGAGAAMLVLAPPLAFGAARLVPAADMPASLGSFLFVGLMLLLGSAGEEIVFRGYGFQLLLRSAGAWATIVPVGVLFALLHASNPNATRLGLVNTAGFGILFGYAFLRSRDLWLPIGLHFGWNFTLPLFGVNVSGIRMRLTGFTMEWGAGTLWSGGEYGPEGSLVATAVLSALAVFLWKAPIRRQPSPLLDPSVESEPCEPAPPS